MASDDGTVIGRAVAVLEVVTCANEAVTLAALTRATGIPKSTVRRIANALADRRMLEITPEGYLPGARLVHQALRTTRRLDRALRIQPYLQDLHLQSAGEIAWFGAVEDGELVFTDAVFSRRYSSVLNGARWPRASVLGNSIVLSAAGRLQVAHDAEQADRILGTGWRPLTRYSVTNRNQLDSLLEQARDTGVATEAEQVMLGWSCSATAIRDSEGAMIGALGLIGGGDRARSLVARVAKLGSQLQTELSEIERSPADSAPVSEDVWWKARFQVG
ncbi:IclR family transcriptional regulator [Nocardia sp. NPDC004582]